RRHTRFSRDWSSDVCSSDLYIGGVPEGKELWDEVRRGEIKAGGFSLNGRWVPLYNIHKTYAGLRDAYLMTRDETAKEMLIKLTRSEERRVGKEGGSWSPLEA